MPRSYFGYSHKLNPSSEMTIEDKEKDETTHGRSIDDIESTSYKYLNISLYWLS